MITENNIRVLIVDDDEDDFVLTRDYFKEINTNTFLVDWVSTYDEAISAITKCDHDIYLIDYRLGEKTGIDILEHAASISCKAPIILLTGKGDQQIDLAAMQVGAADYLVKDKIDSLLLERSVRYALERTKSVETIKKSEEKYKAIYQKSRDVIYITDLDDNFLDVNPRASDLLGYSKEELLKMKKGDLFLYNDEWEEFDDILNEDKEVLEYEATLKRKDGKKLFCLISCSKQFRIEENTEFYQGIIHDITKRKQAEQELLNIEKIAVTGKIARTIAHEVRNPLTNINLALEHLKSEFKVEDESFDLYVDIISRNSHRINQLITELLVSSKPSELNSSTSSIESIIDETLIMANDRIQLKGITIIKSLIGCHDIEVDKEKIKTALINVIINAIEAVDEQKGEVKISSYEKDDSCVVEIEDNGIGISKENLNDLFVPFYTNKPKGMGLGLTSTQNIIINHKGNISVESEEGRGTKFIITLPIKSKTLI